jgi:hypothetical protein
MRESIAPERNAMSDNQMAELYERLVAGREKKVLVNQPFKRGWNAGIDFAIRCMRLSCNDAMEATVEQSEESRM